MQGNLERCLTYTFLLVAFTFTICQGQDCQLMDSPHPQGLCGEKLSQAHANLCFLLRQAFPTHFPNDKRSPETSHLAVPSQPTSHQRTTRDISVLERIYSIPVSVLARLQLTDENWRSFVYKRGNKSPLVKGEKLNDFKYTLPDLQELPDPTRLLIRMLSKRSLSSIHKRSRGLVCECCINQCGARQMATYC